MTFSSQRGIPLTEKGFYQSGREFTALYCPEIAARCNPLRNTGLLMKG